MSEEKFVEIFLQTESRLRALSCKLLGSRSSDLEDVLQEAWIKAWLHRDGLRNEENAASWLTTIVKNECYNCLRRRYAKYEVLWDDVSIFPEIESIETMVIGRIDFLAALSRLNASCRNVICMHYEQGMTVHEIASALDCSDQTVSRMLCQARKSLRIAS